MDDMNDTQVMETDDIQSFSFMIENVGMPYEECGIHFNGEVEISDDLILVTDKMIKQDSLEQAKKNYLKVLEVHELSAIERNKAEKARILFKKLFETFFKGKKSNVVLCATYVATIAINIKVENYLGALFVAAFSTLLFDYKKGFKVFVNYLNTGRRLEQLKSELEGTELAYNAELVGNKEDISLYVKTKIME